MFLHLVSAGPPSPKLGTASLSASRFAMPARGLPARALHSWTPSGLGQLHHRSGGSGSDEDEDIRPILAKVDDLVAAVDDRRVENGYLIACAHWFARLGRSRAQALLGTLDGPED